MIKGMDTIAQYKVMQFIQENFIGEAISVTKVDKKALKITDSNKESIIFEYVNGAVKERCEK